MENKPKKSWYKKWWGIAIIGTLAIIGITMVSGFFVPEEVTDTEPKKIEKTATKAAEQKQEETKTVYTLSATAKAFGQDTIEVKGETNLPDNAVLSINVTRISTWVGEDFERFFTIAETQAHVRNGSFITKVKVDDKKFLEFEKVAGEIIKKLDINVEITVRFNPQSDGQDEQVIKTVGKSGENLKTSPQKDVFGSGTPTPTNILRVQFLSPLEFPYSDQLPK